MSYSTVDLVASFPEANSTVTTALPYSTITSVYRTVQQSYGNLYSTSTVSLNEIPDSRPGARNSAVDVAAAGSGCCCSPVGPARPAARGRARWAGARGCRDSETSRS